MQAMDEQRKPTQELHYEHADALAMDEQPKKQFNPEQQNSSEIEAHQPFVRDGKKIGRNEPCPCGSGKKFKQCHGKLN